MKKIIHYGIWLVLLMLVVANMYIFITGIVLGNKTIHFEEEIKKIHQQNIELGKQVSYFDSLEYAASVAASLDFAKRSTPIVLENLRYALNR